jgi:hypothetical protein
VCHLKRFWNVKKSLQKQKLWVLLIFLLFYRDDEWVWGTFKILCTFCMQTHFCFLCKWIFCQGTRMMLNALYLCNDFNIHVVFNSYRLTAFWGMWQSCWVTKLVQT